jgi:hypothetical protein
MAGKGPEVSETGVVQGQAAELKPFDRFKKMVQQRATLDSSFARDDLTMKGIQSVLEAETDEEMEAAMKASTLIGLRDLDDGTEIEIRGFHVAPGTREDAKNQFEAYVIMDCVLLSTGENLPVNTGIEKVIVYLFWCQRKDKFPVQRVVRKARTGSGNEMITLAPLPVRAIPAKSE